MTRKRYYDNSGKLVRSKPVKPFYKKWMFWLVLILFLSMTSIGLAIYKNSNMKLLQRYSTTNAGNNQNEELNNVEINHFKEETNEDEKQNKKELTYDDFMGVYVAFEGEPYNSHIDSMSMYITVLDESNYESFNRWDYEMFSPIIDKSIEDNILTIEVDSDENHVWGRHSETGTEIFELNYDENKKYIYSINHDKKLYSMSKEDLYMHYDAKEIDYARIIMNIMNNPSLDSWAGNDSRGYKTVIRQTDHNKGSPLKESNEIYYPEDVIELSVEEYPEKKDEELIAYSSKGDGYIKIFPIPANDDNLPTEKYIERINAAFIDYEKIFIEPFEPYEVADFIEHVEFIYE